MARGGGDARYITRHKGGHPEKGTQDRKLFGFKSSRSASSPPAGDDKPIQSDVGFMRQILFYLQTSEAIITEP